MRTSFRFLLPALAVSLAACGGSGGPVEHTGDRPAPAGGSAAFADTLHVALGTERTADGGAVAVRFLQRVSDDRCPANAVCVWAGEARVKLRVRTGTASRDTVLTLGHTTTSLTLGSYTVTPTELHPYPGLHGEDDPQPAPRVVLRIERQ